MAIIQHRGSRKQLDWCTETNNLNEVVVVLNEQA